MQIPKIIHQIWSGMYEPLPEFLSNLGQTWKQLHPEWEYIFWDKKKMDQFLLEYYPQYLDMYEKYPYDIQRWDVIRYMILDKLGGMYVDFDYECLEAMDNILLDNSCCLALDPEEHAEIFGKSYIVTNALMASVPGHPFMQTMLSRLGEEPICKVEDKFNYVLNTTGPYWLTKVYDSYDLKDEICLLPAELTSPLTKNEVVEYLNGRIKADELDPKIQSAVAIHYFFGSWY